MTADSVQTLAQTALNIERIGIIGVLFCVCALFVYLYLKQVKENTNELKSISADIKSALEMMKDNHNKLIDSLIKRSERFRNDDPR